MKSAVGLCSLALLCILLTPGFAGAQGAQQSSNTFQYDTANEVSFTGSVAGTLSKPLAGMLMGAHLLVTTSSGVIDASLGNFRFTRDGAPAITAGQQVTVRGVMKTIQNRPVLLTRTVQVGNETLVIRNEHGFPISSSAPKAASANAAASAFNWRRRWKTSS